MNLHKTLQTYGLTNKQAKVYLACLELGSASVQKIALKAELARSTVYEVLEILRQQSLVSTFMKKKVRYFTAQDPDQVIRLAQNKVDSLKDSLPQFNAIVGQSKNRSTVRFYQGKEGMKIILEEVLDEANEVLSFATAEDILAQMGDYWSSFVDRRVKNKIPVRAIVKDSKQARERKNLGSKQLRIMRILPDKYSYHGSIFIWKNKIAMFSFTNDFVAIVIESQELADVQRAMFNYLWDSVD